MDNNVLVIDDDSAVRSAFKLIFDDPIYNIQVASSGQAGLELLGQYEFGLVFLDLKMPGMNGVETLSNIRKTHPELVVYIVTAFHPEYFAELKPLASIGIGFELMTKPVDSDVILDVANRVLGLQATT